MGKRSKERRQARKAKQRRRWPNPVSKPRALTVTAIHDSLLIQPDIGRNQTCPDLSARVPSETPTASPREVPL